MSGFVTCAGLTTALATKQDALTNCAGAPLVGPVPTCTEQTLTEAGAAALATKASYATSAVTVIAGFTIGEWAGLIGIGATTVTFLANIYFRVLADRREEREHIIRMRIAHEQESERSLASQTATNDNCN